MKKFEIDKAYVTIKSKDIIVSKSFLEFWMVEVGRNIWVSPSFNCLFVMTSKGFEHRTSEGKHKECNKDQYIDRRLNEDEKNLVGSIMRWMKNN